MNWLDMIIFCLAVAGLIKGLFDGFVKQVVSLLILFVAIFFYGKVVQWGHIVLTAIGWVKEGESSISAYIAGFIAMMIVITICGMLIHRLIDVTPLSIFNHLGGAVMGLGVSLLVMSFILNIGQSIDPYGLILKEKTRQDSQLFQPVQSVIPTIYPKGLFNAKNS